MKSTEKYIEIMEKLTGVAIGSQVTFKENTYELTDINADELSAAVTLTCEGQEDISISLKDLIESEEHVVEKKVREEEDDEKEKDDEKDDEKDKDKEKDKDETVSEVTDEEYEKMSDEEKAEHDKKMKAKDKED